MEGGSRSAIYIQMIMNEPTTITTHIYDEEEIVRSWQKCRVLLVVGKTGGRDYK